MKRFLLFPVLLLYGLLLKAQPITLGNNNMPGSGDTLRYTNVQPASLGNYTQTGVSFSWTFTNVVSTTEGVRSFKSGLLTPYALFFLSLNDYGEKVADTLGAGPFVVTKFYEFYKKQSSPNAFIADGAGITFSSVPLPSYYSDKDELYNFPMSYPKYDSTTFKFSTLTTTLIPIRYSKTGYRVTVVDGWGAVTTPYGTQNCLRLITTQYSMDSINTSLGQFTVPFGLPNVQRSYQWLTLNSKIPYMEVTGNLVNNNFAITQARYRGYAVTTNTGTATGLAEENNGSPVSFYPNPVQDKLWLNAAGLQILTVEIYDVQGKPVTTEAVRGNAENYINVSGLAPGIYFVKATQGQKPLYFKFVKQ